MTSALGEQQRQTIRDLYTDGLNALQPERVAEAFELDGTWFGVDSEFRRRTYSGRSAIADYIRAFASTAHRLDYQIRNLVSGDGIHMAEFAVEGEVGDGARYENRGVAVYEFDPASSRIRQARVYFDFLPMIGVSDWQSRLKTEAEC